MATMTDDDGDVDRELPGAGDDVAGVAGVGEGVPGRLTAGDYVDNDAEEEAAVQQLAVISEAEARLRFRREEADALRQIRAYAAMLK